MAGSLGQHKNFIYKAYGEQGATILVPHDYNGRVSSVKYVSADGSTIDTSYIGGNWQETGADKYNLGRSPGELPAGKIVVTLDDGTVLDQDIENPLMDFRSGAPTAPQNQNSGPGGGAGGMQVPTTGGFPSSFTPGQVGFGSVPAYQGGKYPNPVFSDFTGVDYKNIDYKGIDKAPYRYIDPQSFAASFGEFNRSEFVKNASLSKGLALDQLDTELQGLTGFAPAASALKRAETSIDNSFNQFERSRQVAGALPNAQKDLEAQRVRANTYASGRLPDQVMDRALELGVRSAAADTSYAGGFGTGSVASSNLSDLMSAEQRFKIAQYGEGQVSDNLKTIADLLLAPTQYSNAGGQINVMPSRSGSELQSKLVNDINALTTIDPATGLQTAVQQEQFGSNLTQRTSEFNAANTLRKDEFNATNRLNAKEFNATGKFNESITNSNIANNFSLGKFNYDVTYAGMVAGAGQLNTNTQLGLAQQAQYASIFKDMLTQAQNAAQTGSVAQGVAALLPQLVGIINSIGSLFGLGTDTPKTTTTTKKPVGDGGVTGSSGAGDKSTAGDSGTTGGVNTGETFDTGSSGGSNETPPNDVPGTFVDDDGSTVLEPGHEMPDGFRPVQDVDNGTVIVPDESNSFAMQSFSRDLNVDSKSVESAALSIVPQSTRVLRTAGVLDKATPDSIPVGFSNAGKPVFQSRALTQSNDTSLGAKSISTFKKVMAPLGLFQGGDGDTLNTISAAAGDTAFVAQLTDKYQKGDKLGFVNTVLQRFKQPIVESITTDKKAQAGIGAAFTAYNLYNSWGTMSGAQKGIGLASLGLQTYKSATGKNLAETAIIKLSAGNPGLNVGQALGLFQAGYNVYSLVKNWDQLNTLQKVAAGSGSASQIAQLAKSFDLLGNGTQGATAAKSASSAGTSALGQAAGAAAIAAGAYQVSKAWGKGGKEGAIGGLAGGTAMTAGLIAMGATNPYILGGLVAASALGGSVKMSSTQSRNSLIAANPMVGQFTGALDAVKSLGSGKSREQSSRDAARGYIRKAGVSDKDHAITLADGTKADIGADGKSGEHSVSNPSKWVGKAPEKLRAYESDYTNDLDYTAALGGVTLSRILSGVKDTPTDQLGNQLGNAMLKNIGYGKEFSQGNFSKLTENQRAVYAQSGIKSKRDGYDLVDLALKSGRIDELDAAAAKNSLNMTYDQNGYQNAQKLMAGRYRGIEVAVKEPAKSESKATVVPLKPVTTVPSTKPKLVPRVLTKAAAIAQNKSRYASIKEMRAS